MVVFQKWLVPGFVVAIDLFVLWLIWKAIRSGIVTIDLSSTHQESDLFNLTVHRSTAPIIFWLLVSLELFVALALLVAIFIALRSNFGATPV